MSSTLIPGTYMKKQKIGILDSGFGGLSIWLEIVKILPFERILYVCDQKNIPYGTKSSKQIYQLSKKMITFLHSKEVNIIVIACNTISVSCLDKLRSDFPSIKIIGTVPVIKTAAEQTKNKHIGILATPVTAKSNYLQFLAHKYAVDCKITIVASSKLVSYIEKGEIDSQNVKPELQRIANIFNKNNIDTLIMACTHFPFLKAQLNALLGSKVMYLDSGGAVARQLQKLVGEGGAGSINNAYTYEFYTTGDNTYFSKIAKQLIRRNINNDVHISL